MIANEEGTDKGTVGPTRKWRAHNYTDIYEAYLAPLREEPITLLEIGLGVDGPHWDARIVQGCNAQGGASLRMWYRYLPSARILGLDVNPAGFLDNDRVRTGVVDQGDPDQITKFLAEVGVGRLDVIIDDGSHRPDHQQTSLGTLFPYLAPGGIYFIEDLMDNGRGDAIPDRLRRFFSEEVLNTRRVLQAFSSDGSFPRPNALGDPTGLGQAIGSITFHAPLLTVTQQRSLGLRRRLGSRGGAAKVGYLAHKPTLCAIRKAG